VIVYWVDRSGGACTVRAARIAAALAALDLRPDQVYADTREQITERRQGLRAAVAAMLTRQEPDVLAIPADQFSRLPKVDQGWIISLLAKRGHQVCKLDM
jgi:hypothetical protein